MSFEKFQIFFEVGGYEEGFASYSRSTLGIFMSIEPSYTASPLLYANSKNPWQIARYRSMDHHDLGSQVAHYPACERHTPKPEKLPRNTYYTKYIKNTNEHELKMFALKGNDSLYKLSSTDQYIVVMMLFESIFQHVIGKNCILIG